MKYFFVSAIFLLVQLSEASTAGEADVNTSGFVCKTFSGTTVIKGYHRDFEADSILIPLLHTEGEDKSKVEVESSTLNLNYFKLALRTDDRARVIILNLKFSSDFGNQRFFVGTFDNYYHPMLKSREIEELRKADPQTYKEHVLEGVRYIKTDHVTCAMNKTNNIVVPL